EPGRLKRASKKGAAQERRPFLEFVSGRVTVPDHAASDKDHKRHKGEGCPHQHGVEGICKPHRGLLVLC
ncbi:MAG: hypothetical protein KDJ87_17365, partial [Rhizobiaceae bacterium]|nr:hypothetical protein [Rhizobiaceae bacterium]